MSVRFVFSCQWTLTNLLVNRGTAMLPKWTRWIDNQVNILDHMRGVNIERTKQTRDETGRTVCSSRSALLRVDVATCQRIYNTAIFLLDHSCLPNSGLGGCDFAVCSLRLKTLSWASAIVMIYCPLSSCRNVMLCNIWKCNTMIFGTLSIGM